jgi:uncharacterized protein
MKSLEKVIKNIGVGMSLMEQIRNDQLEFRKQRKSIETAVLTTLLGEASAIGKNNGNRETTDTEVVALVKKFIENNNQTIKVLNGVQEKTENLIKENSALQVYLPKQMSEQEIRDTLATCSKELGKIMGHFKKEFPGMYDGALVSRLAKEYVAS